MLRYLQNLKHCGKPVPMCFSPDPEKEKVHGTIKWGGQLPLFLLYRKKRFSNATIPMKKKKDAGFNKWLETQDDVMKGTNLSTF